MRSAHVVAGGFFSFRREGGEFAFPLRSFAFCSRLLNLRVYIRKFRV